VKAPWDRNWLRLTPEQFEEMVVGYLRKVGNGLSSVEVLHRSSVTTPDGEFEMDAVATFEAFGAEFLVLIECKHHKNPIKRELIQVLSDKVSSSRAQKGMLFSTASFQSGAIAIAYARSKRIALIHFVEGGPIYESRGRDEQEGPRRPCDTYFVTLSEEGRLSYQGGGWDQVDALLLA
jgi:restriction system protein